MKVKVLKTCFPDGNIRKAGEVFDYSGKPNKHLEPIGEKPVPEESGAGPSEESKLTCPHCGIECANRLGLASHIRHKHKEPQEEVKTEETKENEN